MSASAAFVTLANIRVIGLSSSVMSLLSAALRLGAMRILSDAGRCCLNRRSAAPMLERNEDTPMLACARAAAAGVFLLASPQAFAQGRPKADPDWPCHQIKTSTFSLASVWSGPDVDLNSQAWRDDPDVVELATKMSRRGVPVEDLEKTISEFKAKEGAEANAKLLEAFGAAFQDLTQQRSQILNGLDRFGRKQRELADRIRAENEVALNAADEKSNAGAPLDEAARQKLEWDLRVFDDRRRTVGYVCESPTLIEQRLGAIARAVQQAL
jgi:hypothetical protein